MFWRRFNSAIRVCALTGIALCAQTQAQKPAKPLTNADVVKMIKSGMPESIVVEAIRSHSCNFETSADALIAVHNQGVTPAELSAMMAASSDAAASAQQAGPGAPASTAEAVAAPELPPSTSRLPRVAVVQNGAVHELALEKTQLAETKTKPSSLTALAADSAVTQGLQSEVNMAAMSAATHINSEFGGSSVEQAAGIFSGIMAQRKPSVTYVWGVPNPASSNIVQTLSPTFVADISRTPAVNPDDFEPQIIKLTPAQNLCRILGATQGKLDARSSPVSDWQVYLHFTEEPVPVVVKVRGKGQFEVSPVSELPMGEYAVVFRPRNKARMFSGGDITRAQGDGLMFDAVWTFQIAETAQ